MRCRGLGRPTGCLQGRRGRVRRRVPTSQKDRALMAGLRSVLLTREGLCASREHRKGRAVAWSLPRSLARCRIWWGSLALSKWEMQPSPGDADERRRDGRCPNNARNRGRRRPRRSLPVAPGQLRYSAPIGILPLLSGLQRKGTHPRQLPGSNSCRGMHRCWLCALILRFLMRSVMTTKHII